MLEVQEKALKKMGQRIKEGREEKALSQNDLASLLGCTQQELSRIENGGDFPVSRMILFYTLNIF